MFSIVLYFKKVGFEARHNPIWWSGGSRASGGIKTEPKGRNLRETERKGVKNKYLNFKRERSGLGFERENRPKSFLSLLSFSSVSTSFKLLNPPPEPNF